MVCSSHVKKGGWTVERYIETWGLKKKKGSSSLNTTFLSQDSATWRWIKNLLTEEKMFTWSSASRLIICSNSMSPNLHSSQTTRIIFTLLFLTAIFHSVNPQTTISTNFYNFRYVRSLGQFYFLINLITLELISHFCCCCSCCVGRYGRRVFFLIN